MNVGEQKLFLQNAKASAFVRNISIVLFCSLIMSCASAIRVPFYPIPFTLQTLAVIAISIFSGRKSAIASLAIFCATYNIIPQTCGYIAAFFAVPFIIGNDASKLSNFKLLFKILLSQAVILFIGTAILSFIIGAKSAFVSGFLLFVPGDIFKGLLVFAAIRIARKRN